LWAAFIHQYIHDLDWARRAGTRDVELRELQQYIFTSGFVPRSTSDGKPCLKFKEINGELPVLHAFLRLTIILDADDFLRVFREIHEKEGKQSS
jgi:hypothetical protein